MSASRTRAGRHQGEVARARRLQVLPAIGPVCLCARLCVTRWPPVDAVAASGTALCTLPAVFRTWVESVSAGYQEHQVLVTRTYYQE